jgi:autotransporter-associated beta strand protein
MSTGYNSRGILSVSGAGTVNAAGTIITVCAGSNINVGAAVAGGGTLKCDTITSLGGNAFGNVNFHGGLLETANGGSLIASELNVYSEGAMIQVDNGTTTVVSPLTAPAGNGVTAIEVTGGGSGYTVAPLVKITTASGAGSSAAGIATIGADPLDLATYGKVTGIVITNPGTNYADGATLNVELLGGDGSGAVAGTAGVVTLAGGVNMAANVSGGLTKLGDGSLTLAQLPTYAGDTTVNQGALNANAGLNTPDATVYVATGATLTASSIVADTLAIGGPQHVAAATVPEPGAFVLLALAVLGLAEMAWRKRLK